jgi:predicted nuclease of predicted toxin-antitoxin system
VRLVVDANLSPTVAQRLTAAGHDAVHVVEIGWVSAGDEAILAWSDANGRVVVSSYTDFGALLGRRTLASPSFVLIRHMNELTPSAQADLRIAAIGEAGASSRSRAAAFASGGFPREHETSINDGRGLRREAFTRVLRSNC